MRKNNKKSAPAEPKPEGKWVRQFVPTGAKTYVIENGKPWPEELNTLIHIEAKELADQHIRGSMEKNVVAKMEPRSIYDIIWETMRNVHPHEQAAILARLMEDLQRQRTYNLNSAAANLEEVDVLHKNHIRQYDMLQTVITNFEKN